MRSALAGALLWLAPVAYGETPTAVVTRHTASPLPLSRTTLAAIFGMRLTTWPDGRPIRVFVLKDDDPLHIAFCKQVLHVFPHQMRAAWDRLVFSGTGRAPEPVENMDEMRTRLRSTEGGIGYLSKDMIDEKLAVVPLR